jgi:histone H3/H4
MSQYINEDTQVTKEAVNIMQKVLVEHARWITNEAEKLAIYEGTRRIKDNHVRDAVRIYFGIREKNEGGGR